MLTRRQAFVTLCNATLVVPLMTACEPVVGADLAPPAPSSEYRLAAGDKVKVTVFGEEGASGIHEVDGTGAISPKLIGRTVVQGKTVSEIEEMLRSEYRRRDILQNPKISVEAVQLRPFFILGEVEKRGSYPYMSGLTVAQAVAVAGGYTYRANRSRITILRQGGGQPQAVMENTLVNPGDVIRVPERYF